MIVLDGSLKYPPVVTTPAGLMCAKVEPSAMARPVDQPARASDLRYELSDGPWYAWQACAIVLCAGRRLACRSSWFCSFRLFVANEFSDSINGSETRRRTDEQCQNLVPHSGTGMI